MSEVTKKSSIVALILGRGNNTLQDKNILPVLGHPLLHWPALAAKRSKYIGRYYISSECDKILEAGISVGYSPILRPSELSLPTSQVDDVVRHANGIISAEAETDIIIMLHANVGTIKTEFIDDCIEILLKEPTYSAVIPSQYNYGYHPLRCKRVKENGLLENYIDSGNKKISSNRQDLPAAVFFDHSFWALRVSNGVNSTDGQQPWSVMGNTIFPYMIDGCFDVHDMDDIERTSNWIISNNILNQYISEKLI